MLLADLEGGLVQGETGSREICRKDAEASSIRDEKSQITVVAVETKCGMQKCLKEPELIWIRKER